LRLCRAGLIVDTKSTGRSFQVMAQSAIDKIPPGPKLDELTGVANNNITDQLDS
jgi:hypothetical protein